MNHYLWTACTCTLNCEACLQSSPTLTTLTRGLYILCISRRASAVSLSMTIHTLVHRKPQALHTALFYCSRDSWPCMPRTSGAGCLPGVQLQAHAGCFSRHFSPYYNTYVVMGCTLHKSNCKISHSVQRGINVIQLITTCTWKEKWPTPAFTLIVPSARRPGPHPRQRRCHMHTHSFPSW